jgi:hypothetical protein
LLNLANRLVRESARLARRNGGTIFFSLRLTARVSYEKNRNEFLMANSLEPVPLGAVGFDATGGAMTIDLGGIPR